MEFKEILTKTPIRLSSTNRTYLSKTTQPFLYTTSKVGTLQSLRHSSDHQSIHKTSDRKKISQMGNSSWSQQNSFFKSNNLGKDILKYNYFSREEVLTAQVRQVLKEIINISHVSSTTRNLKIATQKTTTDNKTSQMIKIKTIAKTIPRSIL